MREMDIIGAGWGFPAAWDGEGNVQLASGPTDIEQAIHLILGTAPGERPMRPDFGCAIHDLVFAPVDATSATLMEQHVQAALERWEPRVTVEEVTVSPDDADPAVVYIEIRYRPRDRNEPRNLVFPFYTIPTAVDTL